MIPPLESIVRAIGPGLVTLFVSAREMCPTALLSLSAEVAAIEASAPAPAEEFVVGWACAWCGSVADHRVDDTKASPPWWWLSRGGHLFCSTDCHCQYTAAARDAGGAL
jgi:hypothetical protein